MGHRLTIKWAPGEQVGRRVDKAGKYYVSLRDHGRRPWYYKMMTEKYVSKRLFIINAKSFLKQFEIVIPL